MRSLLVVVVLPVRENHSRLAERVYQLPVQAFLPESAIEALGVPVLPWPSGVDVEVLDSVFFESSPYDLGDELGPVVGADAVALPGALAYQIERPQLVPLLGVVRDEGPEVAAPDSLLRQSRRQPLPPLARASWRHQKPFLTAEALEHLLVGTAA